MDAFSSCVEGQLKFNREDPHKSVQEDPVHLSVQDDPVAYQLNPRIGSEDPVLDDPVKMTQSSFLIGLRFATRIPTDISYLSLFFK